MDKLYFLYHIFAVIISANILAVIAVEKGKCEPCLHTEKCALFGNMTKEQQQIWLSEFICEKPQNDEFNSFYGFASVAKGDYVCCPNLDTLGIDQGSNQNDDEYKYSRVHFPKQRQKPSNNDFYSRNPGPTQNQGRGRPAHITYPYSPQNPYANGQNPYFKGANKNGNSYDSTNLDRQCAASTSFPPEPASGCCGRDATDADRITGGKTTELEQYPWTVLLKITFNYGDKEASFSCGGSIISPRYVLTAAHCVHEKGAQVKDVEIYLAEYDKRTFPIDCTINSVEGKKCIENIVMHAEDVIPHPGYDDTRLQNDIALLRLRGKAPYTDFIRPICLPPIDIDKSDFSNLPLTVAGWGRNGRFTSDVKQSAVVNLVPQTECKKYYPHLTRQHLCAAGHTGEDTCKGDSGGPLMVIYKGKYFVSGIVSGKRADSPCGTSVPSLYTNVFHYLQWIKENIRN